MSVDSKVVLTCALTGVLTNPKAHPVPVTPEEMANSALEAYNAGASIVHCHFRRQEPDQGAFPTWEVEVVSEICRAIKERVPELIINMSTGVMGPDIQGPLSCLETVKPEMAALNAGSLNYLKIRKDGDWAWPPMLFDNSVEKISKFIKCMNDNGIVPECECFDTGIVRSVGMFRKNGMLGEHFSVSLVMGVASGMPAKASWLPLLIEELPPGALWQTIAIGRDDIWNLHRQTCKLGGNMRTGLEDTFYLPGGEKTTSNGKLIEELAKIAKEVGRAVATPDETRRMYGLKC